MGSHSPEFACNNSIHKEMDSSLGCQYSFLAERIGLFKPLKKVRARRAHGADVVRGERAHGCWGQGWGSQSHRQGHCVTGDALCEEPWLKLSDWAHTLPVSKQLKLQPQEDLLQWEPTCGSGGHSFEHTPKSAPSCAKPYDPFPNLP